MVFLWSCSGRRVHTALRRWMWCALRDLAIVGASFYGNADLLTAIRNEAHGSTNRATEARAVAREAAEGIAEIEDYLVAQCHGPSQTPPRSASRPRRPQRPTDTT